MQKTVLKMAGMAALILFIATTTHAVDRSKYSRNNNALKSDMERAAYGVGMSLGQDFKSRGIEIDPDIIARGIRDVMEGNETLLSQDEAMSALQQLQASVMAKQQEQMAEMAETNKAEGEAFLAENKEREDVMTTESGLQYEIIEEGSGESPKASDRVSVDYVGTFIDGTEFDSSYKRGEPATFSVEGIIPGWTEALTMMKEGAKWRLYIPADLAYGEQGAPPVIEPNKTLVFEVKLNEILEEE